MPIYRRVPTKENVIPLPTSVRIVEPSPIRLEYGFHKDFSATWRLTPASLEEINDIINTHSQVPFVVKVLIRTIGIPDLRLETSDDGKSLKIQIGIGPIQRVQTLTAGWIEWKGLYNSYNMLVQMTPGISRSFKVCGAIPGRGLSEFQYKLGDDGVNLFIDASVPMKEGETPFKLSVVLYSLERAEAMLGNENRRVLILNGSSLPTLKTEIPSGLGLGLRR